MKVRIPHRYEWLWEPLLEDPGVLLRPMFGGKALYVDGHMCLYFAAKKKPWRGVLVCLEREQHAALLADFPTLSPHPVLPKWLYLPEEDDAFEAHALKFVALARQRDPRIGVITKPKATRVAAKPKAAAKPRSKNSIRAR